MIRRVAPFAIALTALLAPFLAAAQWSAPTQSPPSGNAAAPVNTSSTTQTKSGSLVVASLGSSGGGYLLGNLGVGTTSPADRLTVWGTSQYLRFNAASEPGSYYARMGMEYSGPNAFRIYQNTNQILGASWNGGTAFLMPTSGNLGVGTTTPGYKLTVAGDINFTGTLRQNGTAFTSGGQWTTSGNDIYSANSGNVGIGISIPNDGRLEVSTPSGGAAPIAWGVGGANYGVLTYSGSETSIKAASGKKLMLGASNTNGQLTIGTSGNVGIGTTTPPALLTVGGVNSSATAQLPGDFRIGSTGGTGVAYLQARDYTTGNIDMQLRTQLSGSVVNVMRLTSGGNVGIGTASPGSKLTVAAGAIGGTYGITPAYVGWGTYGTGDGGSGIYNDNGTYKKLMVVGNHSANGSTRVVGIWDDLVVAANTYSAGFYYSSDKTLKKNIEKLDGEEALNNVLSLEGVSFDWKKDGKKSVGLIAQDVEKVYPELVSTNHEGLKSVEYGNLVAPLIEAIKEQQRQIDDLKAEVASLKAKN